MGRNAPQPIRMWRCIRQTHKARRVGPYPRGDQIDYTRFQDGPTGQSYLHRFGPAPLRGPSFSPVCSADCTP